jgi:hypothetical protein
LGSLTPVVTFLPFAMVIWVIWTTDLFSQMPLISNPCNQCVKSVVQYLLNL